MEIIGAYIDDAIKVAVGKAVERLEEQVAARAYRGIWSASVDDFRKGQLVTHKGTLWHCNVDATTDRPGTSDAWTLMAKTD